MLESDLQDALACMERLNFDLQQCAESLTEQESRNEELVALNTQLQAKMRQFQGESSFMLGTPSHSSRNHYLAPQSSQGFRTQQYSASEYQNWQDMSSLKEQVARLTELVTKQSARGGGSELGDLQSQTHQSGLKLRDTPTLPSPYNQSSQSQKNLQI